MSMTDDIPAWWNLLQRPPHWQMSDRVVAVHVDAASFNDLGAMQKITAETLGRLGCTECHSGFDIRFLQVKEFAVNPATRELEAVTRGF